MSVTPLADTRTRARVDARVAAAVVAVTVLLGAPVGLLWARVSPRLTVVLVPGKDPQAQRLEGKDFIGADGSYVGLALLAGVVCGMLAWRFARRSGPWTVLALVVGGLAAAKVAAVVGVRPGRSEVMAMIREAKLDRTVHLFLKLRSPWALVSWPVGALIAFLVPAFRRPEELD